MSWDRLPSMMMPVGRIEPAMDRLFQQMGDELVAALAAGSPVDTGALRDSWSADVSGYGVRVESGVRYAQYVEVDTTAAERVLAQADALIGAQINLLFGGR